MSESSPDPATPCLKELPPCPVGTECQLPVDLILRTPNEHEIGAHKGNLELYSEAFPPADSVMQAESPEIVDMEEDAETLKLLLRCMHKSPYPDISSLEGSKLFDLATAAEKYRVHSVMALCLLRINLSKDIEKFPLASLRFGVVFSYPNIVDLAGPRTVPKPLETIKTLFGNDQRLVMAWVEYRELYLKAFIAASAPTEVSSSNGKCLTTLRSRVLNHSMLRNHTAFMIHVATKGIDDTLGVFRLAGTPAQCCGSGYSNHCTASKEAAKWEAEVRRELEAIPPFSKLI